MNEQTFRKLCRKETGGIEMQAFQTALSEQTSDVVSVAFRTGMLDIKIINMTRNTAEQYARWAAKSNTVKGNSQRLKLFRHGDTGWWHKEKRKR